MKIDPIDAIEAARPLIKFLQKLGIPCYLGGSLATSIHGNPRSTIDADLVADIQPEEVETLFAQLETIYHAHLETIRLAVDSRDSFNLLHKEMLVKIDVFVLRHYRYERQVMDRIQALAIDVNNPNDLLPFCSVEDIILNELMWYDQGGRTSERQWSDIVIVMKVQAEALDRAYLDEWSAYLDVSGLLVDALKAAGLDRAK